MNLAELRQETGTPKIKSKIKLYYNKDQIYTFLTAALMCN